MVVLILSNNLAIGGKERQIKEIVTFLAKSTNHQFIILLRENKVQFTLSGISNLHIIVPQKRLSFWQYIQFQKKAGKEYKPDIVHSWEAIANLSAIVTKKLYGFSYKIINGSIRHSKTNRFLSKYYGVNKINAFFSDTIIANSKVGLKVAGFKENSRNIVIPNGFDISQLNDFQKSLKSNTIIQVGMVANFTKPKDYYSLIKASLELFDEGYLFQLTFIGDGPERMNAELAIPENQKKNFKFTGSLSFGEVIELVSCFDIGILLGKKGHSEGMSNSIMEYMLMGLPVICTNTGGNPELITDDYSGFLIPHENIVMLKQKMKLLIDDSSKRVMMGKNAKEFALKYFSIENAASKTLEVYNNLLHIR